MELHPTAQTPLRVRFAEAAAVGLPAGEGLTEEHAVLDLEQQQQDMLQRRAAAEEEAFFLLDKGIKGAFQVDQEIVGGDVIDTKGMTMEEWAEEQINLRLEDPIKWKELKNVTAAKATIGVATDDAWEQAKKDFKFYRSKLEEKCGTSRPSSKKLVDLIFGQNTAIYRTILDAQVVETHDKFLRFIATYYVSCAYQVSTTQLYDKHSRISTTGLLEKEEYLAMWEKISDAYLPPKVDRNRNESPTAMMPLWKRLETAFNTYSRELFLEGYTGMMHVTIDDDKSHYNGTKYSAGLKTVRHTNDNRNGNNLHTCVHTYTQVPVQATWELAVNDSSSKAVERMLHNGMTPMSATGELGDLSNVTVGKDRAYWDKESIHENGMKRQMNIKASTAMRQSSVPLVFDTVLRSKDTRRDVSEKGPKTLVTMKTVSHGKDLYCTAYTDGYGHVTLGLSTEYGAQPEWEMVLDRVKDLKWYENVDKFTKEDTVNKCFQRLCLDRAGFEKVDGAFLEALVDLPIVPLTTSQGGPEWFMLRKFSLTSSTTDKAIAACKGNEPFLREKESWRIIKELLGKTVPAEAEDEDGDDMDDDLGADTNATTNGDAIGTLTSDGSLTLDGLLAKPELFQLLQQQIDYDELTVSLDDVRSILVDKRLGHKLSGAASESTRKTKDMQAFTAWIKADERLRLHFFKPANQLTDLATSIGCDLSGGGQRQTKEKIRERIIEFLADNPDAVFQLHAAVDEPTTRAGQRRRAKAQEKADRKQRVQTLKPNQKLMYAVLSAAYMEPLTGVSKKYSKRGHELEAHIMRACIREHTSNVETPFKILQACTAPLISSDSLTYIRGSIDYVGYGEDEAATEACIGVEIKSRVNQKTKQKAEKHLLEIRRRLGGNSRTPQARRRKYFEVEADSEDFVKVVNNTHEAVQVLHHAVVFQLNRVALLVGNNSGGVIYGIFVSVPNELLAAYRNVMSDIHYTTLRWFHPVDDGDESDDDSATDADMLVDDKNLGAILSCIEFNDAEVDLRAFQMEQALWKDINSFPYPIPRLKRIIPLIFAAWNAIKGGSDATTQLFWHCHYHIPSDTNQSNAVARTLLLPMAQIHRLGQLSSARADLDFYHDLKSFRDLATNRRSFKKSLLLVVDDILARFAPVETQQVPTNISTVTPPPRASRSNAAFQNFSVPFFTTDKTPLRQPFKKIDELDGKIQAGVSVNKMEEVIVDRSKSCTGMPFKMTGENGDPNGKGGRGSCAKCGGPTHTYCFGCHLWFCDKPSAHREKKDLQWKPRLVVHPNGDRSNPFFCQNTCYTDAHRYSMTDQIKAFNSQTAERLGIQALLP